MAEVNRTKHRHTKFNDTSGHVFHQNYHKSAQGILVRADYAPVKSSHLGTHLSCDLPLKISLLEIL